MKANVSSLRMPDILSALQWDKKRIGKKIRFVLPKSIGETVVIDEVDNRLVREAVRMVLSS
jgi:3-dehydroquinate synthetase